MDLMYSKPETFKDSSSNSDIRKGKEWGRGGGDQTNKPNQTKTHTPTKQQNPEQHNIAHTTSKNPDHRAHKLKLTKVPKLKLKLLV